MKTTYYFDANIAQHEAMLHSKDIYFYDGARLQNAPINCINVPIDNFSSYFLTTHYPYPTEISFDGLTLSTEVQNQILSSISNTINDIQQTRLKYIEELLALEITRESAVVLLENLCQYILAHQLLEHNTPDTIVQKMMQLALFIYNEAIILEQNLKNLCKELNNALHSKKEQMLFIHLEFALFLLESRELQKAKESYVYKLAFYDDIVDYVTYFQAVQIVFPKDAGNTFAAALASILLDETFWQVSCSLQKRYLFKIYNVTHNFYAKYFQYRKMFTLLYPIFEQALHKEDAELLFFLHTPLQFSWNSASQTQEDVMGFQLQVEKVLENFISEKMIPNYQLQPIIKHSKEKKKKTLAVVYDRLISGHSVTEVLYTFLKNLSSQKEPPYDIILYNLDFMELGGGDSSAEERFQKLNITYVNLHKEIVATKSYEYDIVQKALKTRQRIIDDGVDILIGFNTRVEFNFLFTTRTASQQVYWSHGDFNYRLKNIDTYISHLTPNSADIQEYKFFHIYQNYTQTPNKEKLQEVRHFQSSFPKETKFLGTISRLIKLDNIEFLTLVKKLLQKHPNSVYLACGPGVQSNIMDKITQLGIDSKRFIFTGNIDTIAYAHIIDIFLDTFPMFQGNSRSEYMHNTPCGVAFRAYINQEIRYRRHLSIFDEILQVKNLQDILKRYQLTKQKFYESLIFPLVTSTQEYEEKVDLLLNDANKQREIALCNSVVLQEVEATLRQEQGMQEFFQALESR